MGGFSETAAGRALFQIYTARLAFRSKLLGGVPGDPQLVEAWLRTLGELGVDTLRADEPGRRGRCQPEACRDPLDDPLRSGR